MQNRSVIDQKAHEVLQNQRVAIFIVAYNASKHIEKVLHRIPTWVSESLSEIYLIDDSSKDDTAGVAAKISWPSNFAPLKIFKTPSNQGYGGNQKIGYSYAIDQGFDIVVLLHGDGQYAPEALPIILSQYQDGADAVFGSRFIHASDALKGGMPLYKFVGNRVLTALQNYFMHSNLSEWHSGYRSYSARLLKSIPFSCNSNDFDFDAEIIIQALGVGGVIKEVPIPTFYGDEICHVNGIRYAAQCLKNVLQYRTMQSELFYDPRFDLKRLEPRFDTELMPSDTSLEYFVDNITLPKEGIALQIVPDLWCANARSNNHGCAVERIAMNGKEELTSIVAQLSTNEKVDIAVAIDLLQYQQSPEVALSILSEFLKPDGLFYASCANIGYFPVRLMLLLGFFNYGRKGILDKNHKRLFTLGSFRRMLKQGGYEIVSVHGFGPPIVDRLGKSLGLRVINRISYWLAKTWVSLFAFEILVVAKKRIDVKWLVKETTRHQHRA